MTRRPDTADQAWIMGELAKGRRLGPVMVRRGSNRVLRLGFSEREPVNLHALEGLALRSRIVIRDGEVVPGRDQEARSNGMSGRPIRPTPQEARTAEGRTGREQ